MEACRRTRGRRQVRALFRIVRGRSSCGRRTLAASALLHQPSAMIGRYAKVITAGIGGGPAVLPPSPLTTYQPACKPGSVWPAARAADVTAIPLARRLPGASSNLPERLIRTDPGLLPRRSYSVLLPVGFAVPFPLPETRCALTAPFHPCRGCYATRRGGLFSVALSLGFPPPDVIRHRLSVEPGLSSPATFR